ncbi:tetratricopeptide repeat-containing sulfotransferase family protein [Peristeroidobacter soli]|uniref:tetratricopeptide repeat-containing sulfotransferase family protein n=1 Tax=Peristeroidobacter soli TaxID=2497877 RepID=UPI00101D0E30|nr:sulfotransferase [Peristeroidobacter soli]
MSPREFWARAQQYELRGLWDEARALYESILILEPRHVPARLRLSRFEQLADRYLTSKEHALRAAEAVREHGSTRHIGYVTARLLDFAEEPAVVSLINAVDWSDPNVVSQSAVLAQQLWLAGDYRGALRFLEAMAKQVHAHPLLIFTRANVYRYLGDMQAADRDYEACLALSPDFADAHWALATHSKARPPLARVVRILDALSRVQANGIEQAHLFYALFREYDAADRREEAWSALTSGAEIMSRRVAFDSLLEASRLEALIRMPVSLPEPAVAAGLVPIFIVGMPRTGTTLLDRILSNHSAVQSLGERNDFPAAVSEASGHFFRSPLHGDRLQLIRELDFKKVGHLYEQRVRRLATNGRYVIDKNPQNLFNLPLILQALPAARVLCLQRDPPDACFSNLKELFQADAYPYSYTLSDLADHGLRVRTWLRYWKSRAPDSVRIVSYEDLVRAPEQMAAAVLDFLGLDREGALHEITRNSAPVSTASSSQVRERIHERGIGAWKRYERQLQPMLARLQG